MRFARFAKGLGLVLLVSLLLAPVALLLCAWRAVPDFSGKVELAGLGGPVEIVRDAHAIPHIYARSMRDAYLALGYVHAQERLFQMEFARRAAAGRLSEILGERGLELDRLFRTLDLETAARSGWSSLDREARDLLSAYAAGVNAWLSSGEPMPIELTLLRHTPAAWRELDSISVMKLMAWQLSGNWGNELRRVRLATRLDPAQLAQLTSPADQAIAFEPLWQVYRQLGLFSGPTFARAPQGARKHGHRSPAVPGAGETLAAFFGELARFAPARLGRAIGSNNWALHGAHTASKLPLLANDPHLALTAPSQWFFAHLEAPGFKVIGASMPAMPGVILGRNAHVAWAFTNFGPDTQDLYFEKLAGEKHYETPAGNKPFEVKRETIRVRGAAPHIQNVRRTRHGPVISDVSDDARALAPKGFVLSLAWVGLAAGDETAAFPLVAANARDGASLREAARHFHTPAQNIVYADTAGSIGFIAAGKLPLRPSQSPLRGLIPAPGWVGDHDWIGYVPFEELPQLRDPESGSIVTANQNTLPSGYPHWLGADFGPPYRADQIRSLLGAGSAHDLGSFARIQTDRHSTLARQALAPMLAALGGLSERERSLVDELRHWDGDMRADARAPLVFAAWLRELSRRVCEDELGDAFAAEWEMAAELTVRALQEGSSGAHLGWCNDVRTPAEESCTEQVRTALPAALDYLRQRFGDAPDAWRWGAAHTALAPHRLFGSIPLLADLFNLSVARGGDGTTVDVGSYLWEDDEFAFENDWGPGFRALYDLADLDRSVGILNSGQSGHVMSPHYRDMLEPWARGEFVPLTTVREHIRAGALGTLQLTPRTNER